MDYIDSLITRSADFAQQDFNPALRMLPSSKSLIIGCVDPRVDPAKIFALEQGRWASCAISAAASPQP